MSGQATWQAAMNCPATGAILYHAGGLAIRVSLRYCPS